MRDAQCKEKVPRTFLMERRTIIRSDNAIDNRIAVLLGVLSRAVLGHSVMCRFFSPVVRVDSSFQLFTR